MHIDHRTLVRGLHDKSVCEYESGVRLPPDTARRLACDANIIPVVLGGNGVALDLGRTARFASRAQRNALRSMYATCAFTGCDTPFRQCEVHHMVDWAAGGRTDLDNLVPVCSRHHHLAHEHRWHLALDADRTLTVTTPHGATTRHPLLSAAPAASVPVAAASGAAVSDGTLSSGVLSSSSGSSSAQQVVAERVALKRGTHTASRRSPSQEARQRPRSAKPAVLGRASPPRLAQLALG